MRSQETGTSESAPEDRASAAGSSMDRWDWIWSGLFALTLTVSTVMALARAASGQERAAIAGTTGALVLWHWLTAVRHPEWEGRPHMALWLGGVLVLLWVLLGLDWAYQMLIYGLFPLAFGLLGRLAVPGVAAITLLVFWRSGAFADPDVPALVASVGGSLLLAVVIGLFVTALARHDARRQEALEALEATRAQLAATARRAGILEERERLAREIHDTVAQGLTGVVMQLEAAEESLDGDTADARRHLDLAKRSARDSLVEVRRSVRALRPDLLQDASLAEAIDRAVRRWSDETGVRASATLVGQSVPLGADSEVALLRVVQEALANVAKHAGAASVEVTLEYGDDAVALRVSDDGAGFDPSSAPADGGMGLTGMRERVEALGGRLALTTGQDLGTAVEATVPLRGAPAPGPVADDRAGAGTGSPG